MQLADADGAADGFAAPRLCLLPQVVNFGLDDAPDSSGNVVGVAGGGVADGGGDLGVEVAGGGPLGAFGGLLAGPVDGAAGLRLGLESLSARLRPVEGVGASRDTDFGG
ncbi:hypothetical protein CA983_10010 [Streptomyces swartbergensis]|uniref:Uncharacterized protein n=1 Tax=Streptomyces swartbergensis TaxID=487165 RepID=A0A243S6X5_9ACTN|nr:hypothetical protein CA983_10010 [Streptomyces swartbergensis]